MESSKNRQKPDAFDALVGEWIGELGQVHQQVKQLPGAVSEALRPTRSMLNDAQTKLELQLASLPGAADKELKRAGDAAIASLATEVGKIAQKIAGDAAEATAADAKKSAAIWQGGMMIGGVLVGSITAYLIAISAYAIKLSTAQEKAIAAELRAETAEADAKKRADETIAAISEKSGAAVAAIAARNAWAATAAGRAAHQLAEAGDMGKIAGCSGKGWEKKKDASGVVWCYIPQSEGFFSGTELVPQFRVPDFRKS